MEIELIVNKHNINFISKKIVFNVTAIFVKEDSRQNNGTSKTSAISLQ